MWGQEFSSGGLVVPEVPHDGPSTSWFWVFKLSKRGERSIVRHVDARHDGTDAEVRGSQAGLGYRASLPQNKHSKNPSVHESQHWGGGDSKIRSLCTEPQKIKKYEG